MLLTQQVCEIPKFGIGGFFHTRASLLTGIQTCHRVGAIFEQQMIGISAENKG